MKADLTAQIGSERFFDIVSHDQVLAIAIKKDLKLLDLKREIWRLTGARLAAAAVAVGEAAEWHLSTRQTDRDRVRGDDTMSTIMHIACGRLGGTLPVPGSGGRRERAAAGGRAASRRGGGVSADGGGEMLLFFKYYDAAAEKLSFVGTHIAKKSHRLTDLLPVLRATKGLPPTSSSPSTRRLSTTR